MSMAATYTIIVQQTAAPAAAPRASTHDEIRDQIRNAIQDAQSAAHEASRAGVTVERSSPGGATRVFVNGAPVPPTPPPFPEFGTASSQNLNVIPPQAVDMAFGLFLMLAVMVIGWPIARAFGRRIERRGESAALSPAVTEQLRRIEQGVEAMAIEVERISESQRFMAKLQSGSSTERV